MDIRNAFLPALAPLLAGLLITAPAVAQEARDTGRQVEDEAMSKAPLGTPLVFSVQGLTKDNIDKVTRGLTSLTQNVYVCPSCEHVKAMAGKCTSCKVELVLEKQPVLSEVLPSLEKASIRLTPFAARTLSYSALEVELARNAVETDEAKLVLAGESRLVLRGGVPADVRAIEKALTTAGLFHSAKATHDAVSNEIHVLVHATATPPVHAEVASVIEKLETKARLVDVIWGPWPIPAKA